METRAARKLEAVPTPDRGPPLLQRDVHLSLVEGAIAAAGRGRGKLLIIEGPAGAGRTRLLAEAHQLAAEAGMELLTASAGEGEQRYPFGVALQLFEARLASADAAERARLLAGGASLAEPLFSHGASGALSDEEAFSFVRGLRWLCSNLAGQRPLALSLDDLQWSDEFTLRFVTHLGHAVDELPLLVLLGIRSSERRRLESVDARNGTGSISVEPLSDDAVAAWVRSRFPEADAEFCSACFEATAGVPFLVEQLVAEVVRRAVEPAAASAQIAMELGPPQVADWVLSRIGCLNGAADLAQAAAVLGEDAELRHAASLAGMEGARAASLADSLIRANVLRSAERLRFVQPIVRNALYSACLPGERADAHLRAARLLAGEGAPAEQVGQQLLRARRDGSSQAVDLLVEAAAAALGRGGPRTAAAYLRRALEEPPEPGRRPRVLIDLGRAEATAGEPTAVERLREAFELADDAQERSVAALAVGRTLYAQGMRAEAGTAFRSGLDQLGWDDGQLRPQLEAAVGLVAGAEMPGVDWQQVNMADTPAARLVFARLALERALQGGSATEVCDLGRRALAGGDLLREETADGLGCYAATLALMIADDLQTAEEALAAAVKEARVRGSVLGLGTASFYKGLVALRRGRVEAAADDVENALAARRYGWRLALAGAYGLEAELLIERGDLLAASRQIEVTTVDMPEVDEEPLWSALHLAARAHVRLLQRQAGAALADYLECGRRLAAAGAHNPALIPWRSGAARASWRLGDRSAAVALVEDELALVRAFGAPGPIGIALHALGMAREGDAGIEALREAVDVLEGSQAVLARAGALVDLGSALRRRGKRRDASAPLRSGLDLARWCGAKTLTARARDEIAASGARRPASALLGKEALSPRELQVARMAAEGLSNRAIAEALFVTVKTIEWHLHHAYKKLEVKSRRELLAALASGPAHGHRS